ncbi:MAG: hypothetical protein WDO13_15940 [Verrucomicrobiota bacterium]
MALLAAVDRRAPGVRLRAIGRHGQRADLLTEPQLEQLVAPIALYPDPCWR